MTSEDDFYHIHIRKEPMAKFSKMTLHPSLISTAHATVGESIDILQYDPISIISHTLAPDVTLPLPHGKAF